MSGQDRDDLTRKFTGKDWRVWHWFRDTWLLANVPEAVTADAIRIEILSLLPSAQFIAFEFQPGTDAVGVMPKESIEWMMQHWGTSSD